MTLDEIDALAGRDFDAAVASIGAVVSKGDVGCFIETRGGVRETTLCTAPRYALTVVKTWTHCGRLHFTATNDPKVLWDVLGIAPPGPMVVPEVPDDADTPVLVEARS
jgi:hypothetical protein